MNKAVRSIAAVGAVIGLGVIAGCSSGEPAVDPMSPEGAAFLFRESVMTIVGNKMMTLNNMVRGEIPADDQLFTKAANDLVAMAGMTTEGFMPQGTPGNSRAAPEIWSDWENFESRAAAFEEAAQAVANAANNGGLEAARDLVRPLSQTCGGCHMNYRLPED